MTADPVSVNRPGATRPSFWSRLFGGSRDLDRDSAGLRQIITTQARDPDFYRVLLVPDSLDGRFEMVVLHAVLVMRRLQGGADGPLAQALFRRLFRDFDEAVREAGVSDTSVGKQIHAMTEAFNGRFLVYDTALEAGDRAGLEEALTRNVYGTVYGPEAPPAAEAVGRLADYVEAAAAVLTAWHVGEAVHWPEVTT